MNDKPDFRKLRKEFNSLNLASKTNIDVSSVSCAGMLVFNTEFLMKYLEMVEQFETMGDDCLVEDLDIDIVLRCSLESLSKVENPTVGYVKELAFNSYHNSVTRHLDNLSRQLCVLEDERDSYVGKKSDDKEVLNDLWSAVDLGRDVYNKTFKLLYG